MRVTWTEPALHDLESIRDYIANQNPAAAARVAMAIVEVTDLLEGNPELGRPGHIEGTRELVIADTPYVVHYEVEGDAVNLLAVVHGRRDWP